MAPRPAAAASAPAKAASHAKKKGKPEEFTAVQPGTVKPKKAKRT